MELQIFQIDPDRDTDRVGFMSLESMKKFSHSNQVDSSIYDWVYSGNVNAKSLEDVYTIFNLNHPEDYKGRSLSVSDVVEIISTETPDLKPGFYFCDSYGFKEIEFDLEKARVQDSSEKINVLIIEPGKAPYRKSIVNDLYSLQQAVGGHIEICHPFEDDVAVLVDEEGKLKNSELNRALRDDTGYILDVFAGTMVIVGSGDEDFCSLTEDQLQKYADMYKEPEQFAFVNDDIVVSPLTKEHSQKSLPPYCFGILPSTGEVIKIVRNQKGYIPMNQYPVGDAEQLGAAPLNEMIGVTKAEAAAMMAGSLFGWDCPAADPSNYNENGEALRANQQKSKDDGPDL